MMSPSALTGCSLCLYSAVASPAAAALDSVKRPPSPILQQIWYVADRIAMGYQIPAAGTIAVVVKPGTEYEVRCDGEESAICWVSSCMHTRHLPCPSCRSRLNGIQTTQ